MFPDLLSEPCTMKASKHSDFLKKVNDVDKILQMDIEARKRETDKFVKDHKKEAEDNVIKNAGITPAQAEQLKNGKHMSKAEKDALVDQMMQQKANLSMDELKQLKTYDSAGQKRWVQSYATEQMAEQTADPKKIQSDQLNYKSMHDTVQAQMDLNAKMQAGWDKYEQLLDTLESKADTALSDLNKELKPLYDEMRNGMGDDRIEQIMKQIHQKQTDYCQRFTPAYYEIIDEYKAHLTETLPDYDRLEQLQDEILKEQTGIKDSMAKPGAYAVSAVKGYVALLLSAFKYQLYIIPDNE